jgi:hypothetical protein
LGARDEDTAGPAVILEHVDLRLNPDPNGPSAESRENNLREQARSWNEALKFQNEAITVKAKLLVYTQALLLLGISAVFALLALSIYAYGSAPRIPVKNSQSVSTQKETSHGQVP